MKLSVSLTPLVYFSIFCVMLYMMMGETTSKAQERPASFWKSVNLLERDLPVGTEELREKVKIETNTISLDGVELFYQTASPPSPGVEATAPYVLLLHGAAFSSQTWVDEVPTIATLAALGANVIAVDLPGGRGKSKGSASDRGKFLADIIKKLAESHPVVIVSPSMSGSYMMDFLDHKENRKLVEGWVPVAPAATTSKSAKFFQELRGIPTMIVMGELDSGAISSRDQLVNIPLSTAPQVLPGAQHPAYLDQPKLWHKLLYNFLYNL